MRVGICEGDVVGRVEHDCDDMLLAYPELHVKAVALMREDVRGDNLRRENSGVSGVVLEHSIEVGGCGSGDEGRSAPVVEEGAGEMALIGRGEPLDEDLPLAKPLAR